MTARIVALVAVTVGLFGSVTVNAQRVNDDHVRAIAGWVEAIDRHSPGRNDGAVVMLRNLSTNEIIPLWEALPAFVDHMFNRRPAPASGPMGLIATAAHQAAARQGPVPFLKRAMMLHMDAGFARVGEPDPPPLPPGTGAAQLVMTRDGAVIGRTTGDWNWLIGRQLADDILGVPGPRDPFVSGWYHAVSSALLAGRQYGELYVHFKRSADVLPDDALALFDRACAAEAAGLPATQQVRDSPEPAFRRTVIDMVPTQNAANSEAEGLLRRSLSADPQLIESRVRLSRVLLARGRAAESLVEVEAALAALKQSPANDPRIAFYAHLVAARASRTLGQVTAAIPHANAALDLFPEAQSALLEQSNIALMLADIPGAIAAVNRLSTVVNPVLKKTDPWWDYQLGSGRNVAEIVTAFRSTVR